MQDGISGFAQAARLCAEEAERTAQQLIELIQS
jgi:hypothetical protein